MSGGGGSSSEKAGGLKEGARRRCMGLETKYCESWTCAAGGGAREGEGMSAVEDDDGRETSEAEAAELRREERLWGRSVVGEFLRRGAPGQPHSAWSVRMEADSGEE